MFNLNNPNDYWYCIDAIDGKKTLTEEQRNDLFKKASMLEECFFSYSEEEAHSLTDAQLAKACILAMNDYARDMI